MSEHTLDETDRELLELLQENARYTATELAERVGVSDNTVHNRMDRLEEAGVIDGYTAVVDHDATPLRLSWLLVCTARISDRRTVAERARELPEVTEVTELMTGERNLHIKAVCAEKRDVTRLASKLDNLNLELNDELLTRNEHRTAPDYATVLGESE